MTDARQHPPSEPPRISDPGSEMPHGLRSLIEDARRDLPGEDEVRALGAALTPIVGVDLGSPGPGLPPPSAVTGPAAAGGASSGGLALAKWLGAGAIVAAAAVGGLWAVRAPADHATRPDAAPQGSPPAQPDEGRVPAAHSTEAAVAPAVERAEPPAVSPAPAERAPEERAPAVQRPSESALLGRAQAALEKDPARALALARQHARLYPSGQLAQEREVILVQAQARLGDRAGAKQRADRFGHRYGGSLHESKVDAVLRKDGASGQ